MCNLENYFNLKPTTITYSYKFLLIWKIMTTEIYSSEYFADLMKLLIFTCLFINYFIPP